MTAKKSDDGWVRLRLATRRCKACDERYARELPNCPVCKTMKGARGQRPTFVGVPFIGGG